MFVLEYVKTLQVLSSPILHNANITVIVNMHHYFCGGIHITDSP
jgi:hypothetical protein